MTDVSNSSSISRKLLERLFLTVILFCTLLSERGEPRSREGGSGGGSVRKIHTHILQITCNVDYAHIPAERNIEIEMEEYLRRDTKTGGRKTHTEAEQRREQRRERR